MGRSRLESLAHPTDRSVVCRADRRMKLLRRQKIWLTLVVVVNAALWLVPSDVVEQIARDRHTLLGRYSRTHFAWILGIGIISIVGCYIDWSTGLRYRWRWFQVLAVVLMLVPSLVVFDFLLRTPASAHYVRDRLAFHRPPHFSIEAVFEDRPEAARSYPNPPPGYPPVNVRLQTDARGFRNAEAGERYDVVVLGDSFAEGSKVSDEHAWPVRLAEQSGLSVYNLGMSSYDPLHYLASLQDYGLPLRPRFVFCLLYEGNDFRSAKADRKRESLSLGRSLQEYFKQSPLVSLLDAWIIGTLGPIGSTRPVDGVELLNWLPLRIPDGPAGRYYTFAPKQLRDLYPCADEFAADRYWQNPRGQLADMHRLCVSHGAEFCLVFAPTKAHVTLPLVSDRLDPQKVRTFTALSFDEELPVAGEFFQRLVQCTEAREEVIADWCQREGIAFLSTTHALREAALNGVQVYYTYDQHWSPDGHAVVAEVVGRFLRERQKNHVEPLAGSHATSREGE